MGIITPQDKFYKDLVFWLRREFKIRPKIFDNITSDDPYDQYLRVCWNQNDIDYEVKVEKAQIGPSRLKDFVDAFRAERKRVYPELLL